MSNLATPLADRIDAAIDSNPHLSRQKFTQRTDSGVVVLTGTVNSFYQKQMAQEALRHLDGVEQIDNQLEVHWS